jgi:hypothetical protein
MCSHTCGRQWMSSSGWSFFASTRNVPTATWMFYVSWNCFIWRFSVIFGKRSKSQKVMSRKYGRCSISFPLPSCQKLFDTCGHFHHSIGHILLQVLQTVLCIDGGPVGLHNRVWHLNVLCHSHCDLDVTLLLVKFHQTERHQVELFIQLPFQLMLM